MRKALCIQDEQLKGCNLGKDGDTGTPGLWGTVRGQLSLDAIMCVCEHHVESATGVDVPGRGLSGNEEILAANFTVVFVHVAPLAVIQEPVGLVEHHCSLRPGAKWNCSFEKSFSST